MELPALVADESVELDHQPQHARGDGLNPIKVDDNLGPLLGIDKGFDVLLHLDEERGHARGAAEVVERLSRDGHNLHAGLAIDEQLEPVVFVDLAHVLMITAPLRRLQRQAGAAHAMATLQSAVMSDTRPDAADSNADGDDSPWSPMSEAHLFHEGLELFNEGEFFEAHEVWEDIWHMASGERKRFYQGLIQCAVTLEHVRRGNPRGVVTVFESATSKFDDLPDIYMGINIRQLLAELSAFIQPIRTLPASMFEPRMGRGLTLPVDLAAAPKIVLVADPFTQP